MDQVHNDNDSSVRRDQRPDRIEDADAHFFLFRQGHYLGVRVSLQALFALSINGNQGTSSKELLLPTENPGAEGSIVKVTALVSGKDESDASARPPTVTVVVRLKAKVGPEISEWSWTGLFSTDGRAPPTARWGYF